MRYLVRDQLCSIRSIWYQSVSPTSHLNMVNRKEYRPFGEFAEWGLPDTEDKAFLGEYYDRDSELSYLNARYYDPKLGMFIQPDWFEVTEPGVGTNRYAYSFNDPINFRDPEGNDVELFEEEYRFNYQNGVTSHAELADWVERKYDSGLNQWQAERPLFAGSDPIFSFGAAAYSKYKGRPDASRVIDKDTVEVFD